MSTTIPSYKLTPEMVNLLQEIEYSKSAIENTFIPLRIEQNIRRQSVLSSSLYSAKIEGNRLHLNDLTRKSDSDKEKIEVFNLLKAINFVLSDNSQDFSVEDIKKLHGIVMSGLFASPGQFRTEMSAIFNSQGIVVYLSPPPTSVEPLLLNLVNYINDDSQEKIAVIKACVAHYVFEKIRPFIDGNGRVGRLILQMVMYKKGYGMKGLLSVEEYLNENRLGYYQSLEEPESDITGHLIFMLKAISETSKKAKNLVLSKTSYLESDLFLPRRLEILNLIKGHQLVTFDFIRRRFTKINERTLRYDLKSLQDKGFITKLGTTNGVHYKPA